MAIISGKINENTPVAEFQGREYRTLPNSFWRNSQAPAPPLRIGVLLDNPLVCRWQAAVLTDVLKSDFAQIQLLIICERTEAAAVPRKGFLQRLARSNSRRRLLYDIYLGVDGHRKRLNDPLEAADDFSFPTNIETLRLMSPSHDAVEKFPEPILQEITDKKLDVVLAFGFSTLRSHLFSIARYGVWSYRHGCERCPSALAYFWEIYDRSPLSVVALQAVTDQQNAFPLGKALFNTQKSISVSANRFAPYWGGTHLAISMLNHVHHFGGKTLANTSIPDSENPAVKRNFDKTPSNKEMLRWLGPVLINKLIRRPFRKPMVQHWSIAMRWKRGFFFEDGQTGGPDHFRWLEAPRGYFWADPFLFEKDGKTWLFFEEYSYAEKRAWISCAEVLGDGMLGERFKCLDNQPRHYSYPYVFTQGREIFMIPEAYDSEVIDLYRCEEFPHGWSRIATLMKGKFVDTSVWYDQGLWWMLTTTAEPDPRTPCLLLFYAESLTGPWHFHPGNPISSDIRNNRGAGRVFQHEGKWIRPSQSCSPIYGYSFALNEIQELSRTRYTERLSREVTPALWKGVCAVHTYNWAGQIEVIDGGRMMPLAKVR